MPLVRPVVVPPGCVTRVKRPHEGDHTTCHCSLNVAGLLGEGGGSVVASLPLARCQLHELQSALPQRYQTTSWDTVFDTSVDGFSLSHFYRNVGELSDAGLCVLVVAPREEASRTPTPPPSSAGPSGSPTSQLSSPFVVRQPRADVQVTGIDGSRQRHERRSVIGCFTSELPNLRHNPHQFYGSRETFVYRTSNETGGIVVHRWDGSENEEFLLSSLHFLGVGGGRDGGAIFLDEDLQFGTSSVHCTTFNCPPLFGRPRESLHHSEFVVDRMLWFALRTKRHTTYGGDARPGSVALSKWYATLHDEVTRPCLCGRGPHSHHCEPAKSLV